MLKGRGLAGRVAVVACALGAGVPFACGGDAFTAGSEDGGKTIDGAADGAFGGDSMTADAPGEGSSDAPMDAPVQLDGFAFDGAVSTVSGVVVDQFLLPMPGIEVHSQLQHATTASDGTFTLTNITFPYIITAVVPAPGNHKHGYVFDTLYRRFPTLQLANEQAAPSESSNVSGTMGFFANNATGIVFADFPAATPASATPAIAIAAGASGYGGTLSWTGASSASPTLYVLQWLETSGLPTGYLAFNSQVVSMMGGSSTTWDPVASAGPVQSQMTVNLAPSSGYVPAEAAVFFQPPGAHVAAPIAYVDKAVINVESFITPDIPGATFTACGVQAQPASDGGTTGAFGIACMAGLAKDATPTLELPQGTTFVSPPTMAGIGTTFTFDPVPMGVYMLAFSPVSSSAAGGDTLYVITSAAQQKVPDLSALGLALPHGAMYVAEVFGFAPFANIDAATSPAGFDDYAVDFRLDEGPLTTGLLAHSQLAPFTIQ